MNRDALVAKLDEELDSAAFDDGQENGLQIEGKQEVQKVATAVSVSMEVLDAAIAWGADALLSHHGLLWKNQPLHVRGVRRARLARILGAQLNLLSYHLPLDAHPVHGNNAALADVADCAAQPGFPYKGTPIGMVGTMDPQPFDDWLQAFRTRLTDGVTVDTGPFQVWDFGPETVASAGFVSGAAPYLVQDAIDMGLDVYVTGEATEGIYHLAKEAGIHVIAGGHYLTERLGVQRLGAWLEGHGLETRFFDVDTRA